MNRSAKLPMQCILCLLLLVAAKKASAYDSQDQAKYDEIAAVCSFSGSTIDKQCVLAHRSDLEYLYFSSNIPAAEKYEVGSKLLVSYGSSAADLAAFSAVAAHVHDYEDAQYAQEAEQESADAERSRAATNQQRRADGSDDPPAPAAASNQDNSRASDEQPDPPQYSQPPSFLSTLMGMATQDMAAYAQNRVNAAQAQAAAAQQRSIQAEQAAEQEAQYEAAQAAAQQRAAQAAAQQRAAQASSQSNSEPQRPPIQLSITGTREGAPYHSVNTCSSTAPDGTNYYWDQDFAVAFWVNQSAQVHFTLTLSNGNTASGDGGSSFGGNASTTITAGIGCGFAPPPGLRISNVNYHVTPQ